MLDKKQTIEMYGKYYKIFKGNGGIPEKITVVGINGDEVSIVRGHYEQQDLESLEKSMLLIKMTCNKEVILTNITAKQRAIIEKKRKWDFRKRNNH